MPITHLFSVSFAKKLWALIGCIAVLAVIFVFYDSGLDFDYVIPKRLIRLLTIGLGDYFSDGGGKSCFNTSGDGL